MNNLPWDNNSWEAAAQIATAHRSRQNQAAAAQMAGEGAMRVDAQVVSAVALAQGTSSAEGISEAPKPDVPQLLLQTVVDFGERTSEGRLIEAVTLPWFDIIEALKKDWNAAYQIDPTMWEEIVAGAYRKAKFDEVILTPRSGDLGRDVIAIKKGLGSVRIIDQVKRYTPPHLVEADDVRALMGVLQTDGASKGFLTTTSDFAPKIKTDPLITPLIPIRLALINGQELLKRLDEIARQP